MNPKNRTAYIYRQKEDGEDEDEERLTWDCPQKKKTFCRKDFSDFAASLK